MQANMRRIVSILLAVMFCVACFTGCGSSKDNGGTASVDVRNAKSIADLAGAKIAAQTGTFHADALEQIPNVQASTYPEFSDLLTALKSGAIRRLRCRRADGVFRLRLERRSDLPAVQEQRHGLYRNGRGCRHCHRPEEGQRPARPDQHRLAEITDEQRSELMEQIVTLGLRRHRDGVRRPL